MALPLPIDNAMMSFRADSKRAGRTLRTIQGLTFDWRISDLNGRAEGRYSSSRPKFFHDARCALAEALAEFIS